MENLIEVFRGATPEPFRIFSFDDIVRQSLERILRRNLNAAKILVMVLKVAEEANPHVKSIARNVTPEFGYAYVQVYIGDYLIYRHPHPLSEIVGQTLGESLRMLYPEGEWSYRLAIPGIPKRRAVRQEPEVQGAVMIQTGIPVGPLAFTVRRVEEPDPPEKSLSDFLVTGEKTNIEAKVNIVLPTELYDDLCTRRMLSSEVEEGGFLVGHVFRNSGSPGSYLVQLTAALPAQFTGASLLHFTFTGDSFSDVKQALFDRGLDERLLGWYHTHLFRATQDFGLSSVDLDLHRTTFTFPWQVAGLLNLDGLNRTLRFYVAQDHDMVLCPHWIAR